MSSFFLCVVVSKMEFKLEDFTFSPTKEKVNRRQKNDLLHIAFFFHVPVPLNAKIKKERKEK